MRQHWYNVLDPTKKQGSWEDKEDELLLHVVKEVGGVERKNKVTGINCGEGFLNKEFEEPIENFGKLAHDARMLS